MKLGTSKPWPEALTALTGEKQLDATAILDYFAPLKTWLDEQNARPARVARSDGSQPFLALVVTPPDAPAVSPPALLDLLDAFVSTRRRSKPSSSVR